MSFKTALSNTVSQFRKWRSDNFSKEEIATNTCDDGAYPGWRKIEDLFKEISKPENFSTLERDDLENVLYLVGRNFDIGSLLHFYDNDEPITPGNVLLQEHFLQLAKAATAVSGPGYDDAKSVVAACFQKLDHLSHEAEEILLALYNDDHEYTKRMALLSLGKLGYGQIRTLLAQSWEIQDQWHKMACLSVVHKYLKDRVLLEEYLNKASKEQDEELLGFAQKIRSDNASR